jgi:hypothetical protein
VRQLQPLEEPAQVRLQEAAAQRNHADRLAFPVGLLRKRVQLGDLGGEIRHLRREIGGGRLRGRSAPRLRPIVEPEHADDAVGQLRRDVKIAFVAGPRDVPFAVLDELYAEGVRER